MADLYSRKISRTERLWVVANKILPTFANKIVLEGHGQIDVERFKKAMATASEANPGSRLVLKGHLSYAKWIDSGRTPPLLEIDGSDWSGMTSVNAPELSCPFPERTGPTCSVAIIKGKPLRLTFCSHHAVMDGRGTLHWLEDIFRVLRNETPVGSDFRLNEMQFVRAFNKKRRPLLRREHIAPVEKPIGMDSGVEWRRRQIKGKYSKLLARIAVFVAAEARRYHDGIVKIAIPVDLRSHQPGIRATGNLTIAINVEVKPSMAPEQVADSISTLLNQNYELRLGKIGKWIDYVPLGVLRYGVGKMLKKQYESGYYNYSALISNLGKIPLDTCSGGGFEATSIFFVPPGLEHIPLFITMTGSRDHIELLGSMPKRLGGEGRIDEIMDALILYLKFIVQN